MKGKVSIGEYGHNTKRGVVLFHTVPRDRLGGGGGGGGEMSVKEG